MKDWWTQKIEENYLQGKQKQFRCYKFNIYILNKVVYDNYIGRY